MIKHIFCDLDGTLLRELNHINKSDIDAIEACEKRGIRVSIATGRLDYEIKKVNEMVGINGYRISQNGAVVYTHEHKLVHIKSLTTNEIKYIIEILSPFKVLIFFETSDSYYCMKKVKLIEDIEQSQELLHYIERPNILEELNDYDISSISIWAEKYENREVQKAIKSALPSHITTYISSDYTLDITNVQNSKGNAVKRICEHDGLNIQDIAVIGDSENDVSMFQVTPHSYVIDTANTTVKQHASHIVKSVAEAINQILDR